MYPAEAGQLPVNKKKNRFKDILPCKDLCLRVCMISMRVHCLWCNVTFARWMLR